MQILYSLRKLLFKNSSNWAFWLLIAVIVKSLYFIIQLHSTGEIAGFWGTTDFDTEGYTLPFENLIHNGTYFPDWRMPGYGVLYLPLYLIFSKATACNILIIIQLILSSLSVYVLALTAKLLFKDNRVFYLTFYIYLISRFSSTYDSYLLTDSLSTSLLIFSTYYFVSYFNGYNKTKLFYAGIFITWVVFLRQVFLLQLCFFVTILFIDIIKRKDNIIKPIFYFILPFIIADGAWTIRNYMAYSKLIPIVRSIYYGTGKVPATPPPSYLASLNFCGSWGENRVDWDTGSGEWWLIKSFYHPNTMRYNNAPFPKYIYTSKFNEDSLRMIRGIIAAIKTDHSLSKETKDKYEELAAGKLESYIQSIKEEKPFLYYVKAPLIHLRRFLLDYGLDFNLYNRNPNASHGPGFFLKFFYNSVFYFIILGLGFFGIILTFKSLFKLSLLSLIPGIPLYTIIVHPFFLKFDLYRYFVPAYPFMVISSAFAIIWLIGKFSKQQATALN